LKRGPAERLVFYDLETGGSNPHRHPITEIGAIATCAKSLAILDEFHCRISFDPNECEPRFLSSKKYQDWPTTALPPQEMARDFAGFLRNHATLSIKKRDGSGCFQAAELVAHNAERHDGPFLKAWFQRLGEYLPASPLQLCVKQRAMFLFREHRTLTHPGKFTLQRLADYFDISTKPNHSALVDARSLREVYQAINSHMHDITESQRLYLDVLVEQTGLTSQQLLNRAINNIVRQIRDLTV